MQAWCMVATIHVWLHDDSLVPVTDPFAKFAQLQVTIDQPLLPVEAAPSQQPHLERTAVGFLWWVLRVYE